MPTDLYPVIKRYLTRQMDPGEQQAFEARIAADPAVATEVVFCETLLHQQEQNQRARWQSLGQSLLKNESPVQDTAPQLKVTYRRPAYRWAIAASLAVAIAAAGLWWYTSQPGPGEQLYATHYTTLNESGSLSPNAPRDAWANAYELYRDKEYAQARQTLAPLLSQDNNADRAHLLTGLCWLEEDKPAEALQALSQVRPSAAYYYSPARWGMVFAHLRAGDLDQADKLLRGLQETAETPAERAKAARLQTEIEKKR